MSKQAEIEALMRELQSLLKNEQGPVNPPLAEIVIAEGFTQADYEALYDKLHRLNRGSHDDNPSYYFLPRIV